MIEIDGSYLEGGGQIIRTALALSTLTGKPFRAINIRKGRCHAGLKNQHMFAIKALKEICNAHVEGDILGSESLVYIPRKAKPKSLTIDIGTAGSITLLLQALVPVYIFGDRRVVLRIRGGTDTKWSMPIDYLINVLVPHLQKYADISIEVLRRGYYPKGGGKIKLRIAPKYRLEDIYNKTTEHEDLRINLCSQSKLIHIAGVSHASKDLMKGNVAERQAKAAKIMLSKSNISPKIRIEYCDSLSTGSGICLWAIFSDNDEINYKNPVIMGADSLGKKGKKAEAVGQESAERLLTQIQSQGAADVYLSDQLLPFMGFFAPSNINASDVSSHSKTNIYVIEKFLPVEFTIEGNKISSRKVLD
ncbi:RNA 3'-terminal phosphate cyclase [Candidatus Woesearchaeota archaeon]|nr:RNA 3'-terminal phosphate cyclase [Candidatus Woesearchaeota archaeon]